MRVISYNSDAPHRNVPYPQKHPHKPPMKRWLPRSKVPEYPRRANRKTHYFRQRRREQRSTRRDQRTLRSPRTEKNSAQTLRRRSTTYQQGYPVPSSRSLCFRHPEIHALSFPSNRHPNIPLSPRSLLHSTPPQRSSAVQTVHASLRATQESNALPLDVQLLLRRVEEAKQNPTYRQAEK